uniref:Gonadotropin-releasing hormone receptor n=2 Tax=Cacopsylla melanoneura TaxID=428564 RepID=A0A8D8T8A3_9HEMI
MNNINCSDLYIANLSLFDNISREPCLQHAPELTSSAYSRAIILAILAILSFVGNVLTIISIRKNRVHRGLRQHSWNGVYTLILHLSVADLFVTVFCLAGEALWSYTVEWILGNMSCKLFKFLQMFSLYLSTFILVLIGIDRFLAVRYPMKSISTSSRCCKFVIGAWILSAICSLPQMVIFHLEKGPFIEDFYQCVTYGFYTEPWQEQLYSCFSLFFMFICPLLILVTTYVSTFLTISRSDRMFKSEVRNSFHTHFDNNRRRLIHRAKMKSLRISIVIVAAFVIWWTPYYTTLIIIMFIKPDEEVVQELLRVIFFFGMSNSLVNPLIYGAFHLWKPRKQSSNNNNSSFRDRSQASTPNHKSFRNYTNPIRREEETQLVLLENESSRNGNGYSHRIVRSNTTRSYRGS